MKQTIKLQFYPAILVLLIGSLGCGLIQLKTPATPTARAHPTRTPRNTAVPTPEMPNPSVNGGDLIRMWASTGEATSEYGSNSWSAMQVGGAPDTTGCGDASTAWAAAQSDTLESVTAYFMEEPLIPTEINIVQSYNPSQVVKVELIDVYAEHTDAVIYEGEPMTVDECPYTLSIPVSGVDYPIMGVRVTIDQSALGLGWNEIDAVEMVGYAEGGYQSPPRIPDRRKPYGRTYTPCRFFLRPTMPNIRARIR